MIFGIHIYTQNIRNTYNFLRNLNHIGFLESLFKGLSLIAKNITNLVT